MYVPVIMERREKINKSKKPAKVKPEDRCHLSFRILFPFKKRWNWSNTSLCHSRKEKAFPLLYWGKGGEGGGSSNTDEHIFENRTNNTLTSPSSLNHRGEKPSYTRVKSFLEQGREILVR